MKWRALTWALGMGSLLVAGCDDEGPSVQVKECRAFCAALEKCDSDTDVADCEDICASEDVRSEAYFEAKSSCATRLSCNEFQDEFDPRGQPTCGEDCNLDDCIADELGEESLSDDEEQLCESVANNLEDCDSKLDGDDVERACERALPGLSPDYVDASEACITTQRCGEIEACLDELADDYDTDVKLYSGEFEAD